MIRYAGLTEDSWSSKNLDNYRVHGFSSANAYKGSVSQFDSKIWLFYNAAIQTQLLRNHTCHATHKFHSYFEKTRIEDRCKIPDVRLSTYVAILFVLADCCQWKLFQWI